MLGMKGRSHFKALGWADPSVIAMTDRGHSALGSLRGDIERDNRTLLCVL